MNNRTLRGTTLIEVAIASAVLAIMVALVMLIFHNAQTQGKNTSIDGELTSRGRMITAYMRHQVAYARFAFSATLPTAAPFGGVTFNGGTAQSHTAIRYQVPIITSAGVKTYGSVVQDPFVPIANGYHEIAWQANLILRESSGAPAPSTGTYNVPTGTEVRIVNRDLNGDGDQDDTLGLGNMIFRTFDATVPANLMHTARMDDYVLLRLLPGSTTAWDGLVKSTTVGIDPDNVALTVFQRDPIFMLMNDTTEVLNTQTDGSMRKLRVNVWHGNFDDRMRILIMRQDEEDVRLENPQDGT